MKPSAAILAFALLLGPVLGQTNLTTPSTGTHVEGSAATEFFGWAAKQTLRFMDATHVGQPRSIKGVSFRLDRRNFDAIGRRWSQVQIRIGHGDFASLQYNKSNQYTLKDTPVLVFDQPWSFPALKGTPPLDPASWGGVRNSLSFRFNKPFAYNGKDAIFYEFRFSGGVADNNVPWIGPNPKGFEYHLDSMPEAAWRGAGGNQSYSSAKGKSGGCFEGTGKTYLTAKFVTSPKLKLDIASYGTAPNRFVLYALGLHGQVNGQSVGSSCELFFLDLQKPFLLLDLVANSKGYANASFEMPRDPALQQFWIQGIWLDSKTTALKLTNALRVTGSSTSLTPFLISYETAAFPSGTEMSVWTAAPKGLPYVRYDI
jgi:hypothetical protein